MTVREVVAALESLAPRSGAEPWDRVGLMVGSETWPANRVMLTIDLTGEVLAEAVEGGVQMVIAYHPPIFEPLTSLTDRTEKERVALEAARAGIAVYSPHTALDAAPDGVNDWLAHAFGAGSKRPLVPHASTSVPCKIVTFCPRDAADALRSAMAAAGAGGIGAYELCSFEIAGAGTFLGGDETNPVVGRRGSLQRVDEVRLEMVCPRQVVPAAVEALRRTHPYEEPPVDVYPLESGDVPESGTGRRIDLETKLALADVVARLKSHLGVSRLDVGLGRGAPERYGAIGLCAGAGGSLLEAALGSDCELFLTGEMRHHDVLAAQAAGCTVVLAGHTNTERGYLEVLQAEMARLLSGISFVVSARDRDPLVSY